MWRHAVIGADDPPAQRSPNLVYFVGACIQGATYHQENAIGTEPVCFAGYGPGCGLSNKHFFSRGQVDHTCGNGHCGSLGTVYS